LDITPKWDDIQVYNHLGGYGKAIAHTVVCSDSCRRVLCRSSSAIAVQRVDRSASPCSPLFCVLHSGPVRILPNWSSTSFSRTTISGDLVLLLFSRLCGIFVGVDHPFLGQRFQQRRSLRRYALSNGVFVSPAFKIQQKVMNFFIACLTNKAASPNRRPRFPLGAMAEFVYGFCAQPSCLAAVGEPRRWG
jgi:hypothetical protein